MGSFLSKLLDTSDFPPRWVCGVWTNAHGWLHITSDVSIWAAYTLIAVILGYFLSRRPGAIFPRVFVIFGAFFFTCAAVHLLEAVIFWWPAYRLSAVLKLATAAVSWTGAVLLLQVTPRALSLKSPDELERANRRLAEEIDERRRIAETLRRSQERFTLAMRGANDGLWDWNLETDEVYYSPRWKNMLGYDEDELENHYRTWERLVHPDDLPRALEAIEGYLSGRLDRYVVEFRMQHRDGHLVDILSRGFAVRTGGKPVRFVGTHVDITERKQAERVVRKSEERVRAIVDTAADGIITFDASGTIESFNPAAERMFGFPVAEIIGGNVSLLFPSSDCDDETQDVLSAEDGTRVVGREMCGRKKDGTLFPLELSVSRLEDEGPFIAVVHDVTERKRALEELRRSAARLQESNRELEQFAYVASHDLQEPLRAVSGYCRLLQQRYGDELDSTADEFLDHAIEGAKRMQTLIDDLLMYSRVGTRGRAPSPTDCNEVLEQVTRNLHVAIEESQARVVWNRLPTVVADHSQIVQLFQNLVSNAIKFCSEEPPRVQIDAEYSEGQWLFSVCDNGIGIDAQHRDRIFDVFRRLHTRSRYPGTGIGLAICKKIVERHGGTIWIDPAPGGGSIFRFTLANEESR